MGEESRAATTIPIQIPVNAIEKTSPPIQARGTVSTRVLIRVMISEFIPLPAPMNMAEESIPKATVGQKREWILRKINRRKINRR